MTECFHSVQNDELIGASKKGDLMMVASLLNSGADIQTVNKVSYQCESMV